MGAWGSGPSAEHRVVLFVRAGCHLCDAARRTVAEVVAATGATSAEVDIDQGPEAAQLVARYGELVPVVTVDGVQQGYWRVDAARLRRALSAPPPSPGAAAGPGGAP